MIIIARERKCTSSVVTMSLLDPGDVYRSALLLQTTIDTFKDIPAEEFGIQYGDYLPPYISGSAWFVQLTLSSSPIRQKR